MTLKNHSLDMGVTENDEFHFRAAERTVCIFYIPRCSPFARTRYELRGFVGIREDLRQVRLSNLLYRASNEKLRELRF